MHELSILYSVIETAEDVLRSRGEQHAITAIVLQIGELAGVETDSLDFLWPAAVSGTALEAAELRIERVPGAAICADCAAEFGIAHFADPCPHCGAHHMRIIRGEELRIRSLELEVLSPPSTPQPLNASTLNPS